MNYCGEDGRQEARYVKVRDVQCCPCILVYYRRADSGLLQMTYSKLKKKVSK
jgi:hypothetical protein